MSNQSARLSNGKRALAVSMLAVVFAFFLSTSASWFVRTETAPKQWLNVGDKLSDEGEFGGREPVRVEGEEGYRKEEDVVVGNEEKAVEKGGGKSAGEEEDAPADDEVVEKTVEGDGDDGGEKSGRDDDGGEAVSAEEKTKLKHGGKKKKKNIKSNPCPLGEYPDLETRLCTSWRDLVYDQRMYAVDANGAKYLVCVPPKNGSTYHRGLIFRILGVEGYDVKHNVHFNDAVKDRMFLVNFTDTEIANFAENDEVERYAMIRNPMQRTLSGYMNARGRKLPVDVDRPKDFQEWVMGELPRKDIGGVNEHFRPQWAFCGFRTAGIKKSFKLFRVEEPEKYVDYLYDIVPNEFLMDGWGDGVGFRDYVLGPRKRTHGTDEMFWRYVGNMEVFDMIAKVMKDDIEFLGYEEDVKNMREEFAEILEQGKE